jgi:hypothetical protein
MKPKENKLEGMTYKFRGSNIDFQEERKEKRKKSTTPQ